MTNKEEIVLYSEKLVDAILHNKDFNKIVEYSKKAKLDYVFMGEFTPVIAAALTENIAVLEYLRKNGANLNQTNNVKQTALHFAFRYNKLNSAKYLLSIPEVEKNFKDIYGTKPIDWANYWNYKTLKNLYNKYSENDLIK